MRQNLYISFRQNFITNPLVQSRKSENVSGKNNLRITDDALNQKLVVTGSRILTI